MEAGKTAYKEWRQNKITAQTPRLSVGGEETALVSSLGTESPYFKQDKDEALL